MKQTIRLRQKKMNIQILEMIEGARQAKGLTVIIDVFRAFSLECYLMAKHPAQLCPVGAKETAYIWKENHPEAVLIGERHGVILPGFQYGNSPSQTADADLEGKTLIHTTSAGTQGIVNAAGAEEIITGSLVNAAAIARYIQKVQPEQVSLVAMGLEGKASAPEDVLCARYIKSLVEGTSLDMEAELETLRHTESGEKFFRPETQKVFPAEDYQLCTDVDRFDFVLQVTRRSEDMFEVHRVDL